MKAKVKATGKIVDGIPIYYGSEGKGYLDVPVDHDIFDRYDLEEVELLEQPSLSEGLEEAANTIPLKLLTENKESYTFDSTGMRFPKDCFKAGAKWMVEQIKTGDYIDGFTDGMGVNW